jgi:hypothetical protein
MMNKSVSVVNYRFQFPPIAPQLLNLNYARPISRLL